MAKVSFCFALPSVTVAGRGCAVENLHLRKKWKATIAGRLIEADGSRGPEGIELDLERVEEKDGKISDQTVFSSGGTTNANGEYSFDEVAEGHYRIVMNRYRFPTIHNPYHAMYWPSGRDKSEASVIDVKDAVIEQRYDFKLPDEPKSVTISGIVLGIDGRPVLGANVMILASPEGSIADDNSNHPVTDKEGHFSFVAFKGFEYTVSAWKYGEPSVHSEELSLTDRDGSGILTLLLDRPGRFDNDPAELFRKRNDK